MRKPYILIIFLLGLIVALSIGKTILQNTLSTSGIFVSKIEQEIASYKTQNIILSEELLAASSLTNIAQKAKQAGFVDENTMIVFKASKPLAIKQ
jgi:hypothetical protein